jgi:predicted metal-dependent hydrolase
VSEAANASAPVQDRVRWGRLDIAYEVCFGRRKTLAISVHPELRVSAAAPQGADLEVIRHKVRKHGAWIRAQWRELELYLPKQPPRAYVNGETHRYLGRQYRLRAEQGPTDSVQCLRGYLRVTTRSEPNPTLVKQRLMAWYRERAVKVFAERLDLCCARAMRDGIPRPTLRIRRLQKRWGSCDPGGVITLNLDLIRAPTEGIDYVITHELCHLKESHHGPCFCALLAKLMPGFEQLRERLNRLTAQ